MVMMMILVMKMALSTNQKGALDVGETKKQEKAARKKIRSPSCSVIEAAPCRNFTREMEDVWIV
jgi:hypothetical protein